MLQACAQVHLLAPFTLVFHRNGVWMGKRASPQDTCVRPFLSFPQLSTSSFNQTLRGRGEVHGRWIIHMYDSCHMSFASGAWLPFVSCLLTKHKALADTPTAPSPRRLRAGEAIMRAHGRVMGNNSVLQAQTHPLNQQSLRWPPSNQGTGVGPSPHYPTCAVNPTQQPSAKQQATARSFTSRSPQFPFSNPTPVPQRPTGNLSQARQPSAASAQQRPPQPAFSGGPPQPSGHFNVPGTFNPLTSPAGFGVPAPLGTSVRGAHSHPVLSKPHPLASKPDRVFGSVPLGGPAGLATPGTAAAPQAPTARCLPSDAQDRPSTTGQAASQAAQRQPFSQILPSGGPTGSGDPMQVDSVPQRPSAEHRSNPQEHSGRGEGPREEGRREVNAPPGEGGGPEVSGQRSGDEKRIAGEGGGSKETVGGTSGGVGGGGKAQESCRDGDGGREPAEANDALGEDGHVEVVDREDEPAKGHTGAGRRDEAEGKAEEGGADDRDPSPEASAPGEDFIALPPSSPDVSAGDFAAGATRGFRSPRYRVSGGVLQPTAPKSSGNAPEDALPETGRAPQPVTAPEGAGPRRPGPGGAMSRGRTVGRRPVVVPWKYRDADDTPPSTNYNRPSEAARRKDSGYRSPPGLQAASVQRSPAKRNPMQGRALFQGRGTPSLPYPIYPTLTYLAYPI